MFSQPVDPVLAKLGCLLVFSNDQIDEREGARYKGGCYSPKSNVNRSWYFHAGSSFLHAANTVLLFHINNWRRCSLAVGCHRFEHNPQLLVRYSRSIET